MFLFKMLTTIQDTTKISTLYPNLPHIKVAIIGVFERMAKTMNVNHDTQ